MLDGRECVELIEKLEKLSIKDIEILKKDIGQSFLNMRLFDSTIDDGLKQLLFSIESYNRDKLFNIFLKLKKKEEQYKNEKQNDLQRIQKVEAIKSYINNIEEKLKEKEKIIEYFEEKQSNLDEVIQDKISQILKDYEDKVKKLEQENKELKEQLGYYG